MMTKTKLNKPRSARSLTTTLATAFFTLSVVSLLVSGSLALFATIQATQNAIFNNQRAIAQDAANTVGKFIQDKFSDLEVATKVINPVNVGAEIQKNIMESLLGYDPAFRQFALLDSQGQQLAQVSRISQTLSSQFVAQLKGDILTQTSKGQRYISPVYIDNATSEPLIAIAVPVKNVFGDFQGTLMAEVNLKFMWELVNQLKVGETGYAYVVDNKGNLITYRDTSRVLRGENVKNLTEVNEFLLSGSKPLDLDAATLNKGIEGTTVIGSFAPLGTPDWAVITELPWQEAYQPIFQVAGVSVGIILLMAVLAGVVGTLLARRLVVPLTSLTETATRIAGGDLGLQTTVSGSQEVISLATAFNSMTVQLRSLFDTQEQRVAERTHDLELASEVGRTMTEKVANLSELLSQAAELIRSRFDLYYTQIYMADSSGHNLNLQAGTGQVGHELLRRRHHLPISSGSLNGRAAADRIPLIVADTQKSGNFLPNPLLPLTRSEMVVPLIANGKVLGVLDMQSEHPNTFRESNLPAFQVLAGQLAIAIQNAELFQQAEESRLDVEAQAKRLTAAGWQEFLNAVDRSENIGYVYDQNEVRPLVETETQDFASENTLAVPIEISGARVGEIRLADESSRQWSTAEMQVVRATVTRVAQHIENLRLLAQAERYRAEAEQVSRRLTSQGWDEYLKTRHELTAGYIYDQNQVRPFNKHEHDATASQPAISHSLVVHHQTIGELIVDANVKDGAHVVDIVTAVAQQLSEHIENLRLLEQAEQRRMQADGLTHELAQRASQLETVATLSTTASTVLDPDKLLQDVVDLTKERFGLYHAHIYLTDEAGQTLVLASGAGEIGRQMVAEQHAISIDEQYSQVARAAREQKVIIINDVQSQPSVLPDPLLPDTRSEMAIPMIIGSDVIGIFDVQSNRLDGFSKEDASIYTTLAAQVAVALQNARLYAEQAATVTQLRELDRLKSAFLANMSHELRTPLNSIIGFADVMLEGLDGELTENMDSDLGLIRKNGQHLLNLINDVLDMAKIESGSMNLNPESFYIYEVVDEVINITSTLADNKNLVVSVTEDSDRTIEVYADRTRMKQVMINLVNNSIKFTDGGGIAIHAKRTGNDRLLITVKDTGIGIPPDKLESIFQEFTQVDISSTRKVGGTGLGLPISRKLVEMHGGRLWAESGGIYGEGSSFYVEMPLIAQIVEQ